MSRLSASGEITIPLDVLREAGLSPGDELIVRVVGSGHLEIERIDDLVVRWAGGLPSGTYPPDYLHKLRNEWEQ